MLIMEDQSSPEVRRFYLGHAQVRRATRSPCRCLFGPPDPAATQRFIQEEMRLIYEGQKKKWNFDFEREQPLPGRFQWEAVDSAPPEQSRTEAGFRQDVVPAPQAVSEPVSGHEVVSGPAPASRPAPVSEGVVEAAGVAAVPAPAVGAAPAPATIQRQITGEPPDCRSGLPGLPLPSVTT